MKDFGAIMGRDGDVFGATVTIRAGDSRFEAGISRRHGGIHWSIDDIPARDNGKKIGESSFSIAKKLWEGG